MSGDDDVMSHGLAADLAALERRQRNAEYDARQQASRVVEARANVIRRLAWLAVIAAWSAVLKLWLLAMIVAAVYIFAVWVAGVWARLVDKHTPRPIVLRLDD